MLEKEVLELVVKKVMDKFARENDGSKGWTKEDIQHEDWTRYLSFGRKSRTSI